MGKSLFEKMGLIEKLPEETPMQYEENYLDEVEEEVDVKVDVDEVISDTFVSNVYAENELSDLSKSIFKVEEIGNNLPNTMPKATKQASVLGILSSFGLTNENLKEDAKTREEMLKAALGVVKKEKETIISNNQNEIEKAKLLIEKLQLEITNCEKTIKETTEKVDIECNRIVELVEFIGGENK